MADNISKLDMEFALVLGLQEATLRTYRRMAAIFEGLEAVTNSGIQNPFVELANGEREMVELWRNQISEMENASEIFRFIRNHSINISWHDKGE